MRIFLALMPLCLLLGLFGCSKDSSPVVAAGEGHEEQNKTGAATEIFQDAEAFSVADAGGPLPPLEPEGAPRVKPRLVTIQLPRVVHRSVELNNSGIYVWGDPEPLDEVRTCVIERRDAFALFQPYQALEQPICTITAADEQAELSGIPANSDLTITVSKDGYIPAVMTHRVESLDVPLNANVNFLMTVLFDAEQAELFSVPVATSASANSEAPGAQDEASRSDAAGFVTVEFAMYSVGFDGPGESGQFMSSTGAGFTKMARGGHLGLRAKPGGNVGDFDMPASQLLLEAPPGIYRVLADHPRADCEAVAMPFQLTLWGLPTDAAAELELRVLPGHVSSLFTLCLCFSPGPEFVSLDETSCTFEERPADADAGVP